MPDIDRPRKLPGCLAVLVALVVVVGLAWFGGSKAYSWLDDQLHGKAPDYAGPGSGKVTVQVHPGDSATAIGHTLEDAGVVKSTDAFIEAADANPDSGRIQIGYYTVKKKMKAADAVKLLADPDNLVQNVVAIPEGLSADQIVDRLAESTHIKSSRFEHVLESPGKIGLPKQAKGDPEGYLFPATYTFAPHASPRDMLSSMVDRWKQAASDVDLGGAAHRLGYTRRELMTVASLVQAEAREPYMNKVARVIYNRLEDKKATGGMLQLDATVNYANGDDLGARTTGSERTIDSPYNTYKHAGLPPGPIESPGEDAMDAAVHPASGNWLYYVTVNLRTGKTKFASTLAAHNKHVAELDKYCRTQSERC